MKELIIEQKVTGDGGWSLSRRGEQHGASDAVQCSARMEMLRGDGGKGKHDVSTTLAASPSNDIYPVRGTPQRVIRRMRAVLEVVAVVLGPITSWI